MNRLLKYLNQPYPKNDQNWPTVFLISLFVFLFLFIYQPFGLNSSDQKTVLIVSAYFAGVTFFVLFIHLILIENLFKNVFNEGNWTTGKELLWLLWILISIALANALFDVIYNSNWNLTISLVVDYVKYTLAVALFPVIVMIVTRHHILFKKYESVALNIERSFNSSLESSISSNIAILYDANQKHRYEFEVNKIVFLESTGNYVNVMHFDGDHIENTLIRNTITKIVDYLDFENIIRCHRAYIVNLSFVSKVEGNAQGLKLHLSELDNIISVSRNYVPFIRDLLNQKK